MKFKLTMKAIGTALVVLAVGYFVETPFIFSFFACIGMVVFAVMEDIFSALNSHP